MLDDAQEDQCLQEAMDLFFPHDDGTALPEVSFAACDLQEPILCGAQVLGRVTQLNMAMGRKRVGRPRLEASTYPVAASNPPGCHQPLARQNSSMVGIDAFAGKDAKRPRGPKPKYVYSTTEEAVDARRERNRRAALNSYYRKRSRVESLESEARRLDSENSALEQLLVKLAEHAVPEELLTKLRTDEDINVWLEDNHVQQR